MTTTVFDGHNDTLLRLSLLDNVDPVASFIAGDQPAHIDSRRGDLDAHRGSDGRSRKGGEGRARDGHLHDSRRTRRRGG